MDQRLLTYLGSRVRDIRLEKHMTQQDLSNRTGIAPYYISRIENGKLNIRVDMLFKLAKGLDVDVTEIVKDW